MNIIKIVIVSACTAVAAMQASASLSAKSYIRSGMIGQWDGEENVGFGQHDPTSALWADLSGNYQTAKGVPMVSLPSDAVVLDQSVQMTRAYGCPTNTAKGSGSAKIGDGPFLQAFVDAKYSVEVAFDMAQDGETGKKSMVMIGYSGWWFGAIDDRYLGFNPNDAIAKNWKASKQRWDGNSDDLNVKCDLGIGGVAGRHVLSCVQDGESSRLAVDDLDVVMNVCTPTNGINQSNGFRLNRSYDENAGMNGKYHSIRIYDRALTVDEVAVNRAVDRVRFFGARADEEHLPAGWHFETEGGDVKLMQEFTVGVNTSGAGLVSVNGGTSAEDVVFCIEHGTDNPAEIQLSATAGEGYRFCCWRGVVSGDDVRHASGMFAVTGNVVAVFYKTGPHVLTAKSYVLDGLIGQWDGEENAGSGSHDSTSVTWCDLTGTCVDAKGRQLVTLPADAEVLEKGIRMTSQNGCPTNGVKGDGVAGYDYDAFLNAFKVGRYSVEIAFDMAADGVTTKKSMLIAGYTGWWFGAYNNRYLGFNPNDAITSNWKSSKGRWDGWEAGLNVKCDLGVGGVSGQHVLSCVQDGGASRLSVDDLDVVEVSCEPTNGVNQVSGFRINRTYSENSGMNGDYHAIRIYDRALTVDEVAVNRAVDQVRFFGADPESYALPDGWRFGTTDGVALERKHLVSSCDGEMGTVSARGGAFAAAVDAWVDVAAPTVALAAVPKKGYKFKRWTGAIEGDDLKSAMGVFKVAGDVQAEFKEESGIVLIVR